MGEAHPAVQDVVVLSDDEEETGEPGMRGDAAEAENAEEGLQARQRQEQQQKQQRRGNKRQRGALVEMTNISQAPEAETVPEDVAGWVDSTSKPLKAPKNNDSSSVAARRRDTPRDGPQPSSFAGAVPGDLHTGSAETRNARGTEAKEPEGQATATRPCTASGQQQLPGSAHGSCVTDPPHAKAQWALGSVGDAGRRDSRGSKRGAGEGVAAALGFGDAGAVHVASNASSRKVSRESPGNLGVAWSGSCEAACVATCLILDLLGYRNEDPSTEEAFTVPLSVDFSRVTSAVASASSLVVFLQAREGPEVPSAGGGPDDSGMEGAEGAGIMTTLKPSAPPAHSGPEAVAMGTDGEGLLGARGTGMDLSLGLGRGARTGDEWEGGEEEEVEGEGEAVDEWEEGGEEEGEREEGGEDEEEHDHMDTRTRAESQGITAARTTATAATTAPPSADPQSASASVAATATSRAASRAASGASRRHSTGTVIPSPASEAPHTALAPASDTQALRSRSLRRLRSSDPAVHRRQQSGGQGARSGQGGQRHPGAAHNQVPAGHRGQRQASAPVPVPTAAGAQRHSRVPGAASAASGPHTGTPIPVCTATGRAISNTRDAPDAGRGNAGGGAGGGGGSTEEPEGAGSRGKGLRRGPLQLGVISIDSFSSDPQACTTYAVDIYKHLRLAEVSDQSKLLSCSSVPFSHRSPCSPASSNSASAGLLFRKSVKGGRAPSQLCACWLVVLVLQLRRRPSPSCLNDQQQEITPAMRAILVDWLVEVSTTLSGTVTQYQYDMMTVT